MNSELTKPRLLFSSLTSGLVIGMLQVALAISLAALIFSGSLAIFVPLAIGYALLSGIIGGVVIALFTSLPGVVGGTQDAPAAIMALISVAVAGSMPATATAEEIFITVVVTLAISTLLTGLVYLGTGYFQLGGLVRFLPYPVIGGFLAGTGWLLATGAIGLMTGLSADLLRLPALLQPDMLIHWLPGALLALLIMFLMNRSDHFLVLPGLLFGSLVVFYLIAWIAGYSAEELGAAGWLLGPFAGEGLWQPLLPADLAAVYWPAVIGQAASIAAVVLISIVGLLLNAGGLELAFDKDIDFDKELRVGGAANSLIALVTGLISFHFLSFSVLNHKLGTNNRLSGLIAAAVCLLVFTAGASFLALVPKIVVGALPFLLGLSFIVEWVVDGWKKLPRIDYAIVLTILLVTALLGFLQAVALGLLLAVVLFVVGYSRVDVVRHELSAVTYHSRVVRSPEEEKLLLEYGEEIYLLQLQGFIFFGTADSLLNQVRQRRVDENLPRLSAVVLDFERVSGLDTTAMVSFSMLEKLAGTRGFALVLCGANKRVRSQLEQDALCERSPAVSCFDSVDQGMAWCENRLITRLAAKKQDVELAGSDREKSNDLLPPVVLQMARILESGNTPPITQEEQHAAIRRMLSYFEQLDIEAGTQFISQGQPAATLYFLAEGQTTARLNMPDGSFLRLETMGSGRIIGDVGFFLGDMRTADVIVDKPSSLFSLTRSDLARMKEEDPEAASLLYRLAANILAERVARLTKSINALER
jgi:sulfate permease, SulP family